MGKQDAGHHRISELRERQRHDGLPELPERRSEAVGVRYVTRPLCFVCSEPIGPREGVYIHGNIYVVTDDPEARPGIPGCIKVAPEEHAFHHKCLYQFTGDAAYDGVYTNPKHATPPPDWVHVLDDESLWDIGPLSEENTDG